MPPYYWMSNKHADKNSIFIECAVENRISGDINK